MSTDWTAWHEAYSRPGSGLDERLAAVQASIARRLDEAGHRSVRVISACAGDARDLVGILATRADAHRVTGLLVEYDSGLAERARAAIQNTGARFTVRCDDAGDSSRYTGFAPADLVLMCGVFGNISEPDVGRTIAAMPQLCETGAEVIWTRHRGEPDLTPQIRDWFMARDFEEVSFVAPGNRSWSVGTHRFVGDPQPLAVGSHWFTFIR